MWRRLDLLSRLAIASAIYMFGPKVCGNLVVLSERDGDVDISSDQISKKEPGAAKKTCHDETRKKEG